MMYSLAVIRVEDYGKWKDNFDGDESTAARSAAGEKSYRLFRTLDDENAILLLNEWEDEARAREFFKSDRLRGFQRDSGVLGKPDIFTFVEIEGGTL